MSNGWADAIKPDFITFHHRGAYSNSYGIERLYNKDFVMYLHRKILNLPRLII
ncbi:chondroitinase family polysaccharide lyase [Chryseobacterium sp. CH1]|uniref:chondroitinase family polysaccharide lyase n=1 Tax=Chryseobacterium sp. CH1 TaxID=713551 RepID=UPI00397766DD